MYVGNRLENVDRNEIRVFFYVFIGTIIFSIHQPRYSIFKLFDNILLLSSGHTIYLGLSTAILPYFSFNGFKCEEHDNPADFLLDVLIECNNHSSTILQTAYTQSTMYLHYENLLANENKNAQRLLNETISRSRLDELYHVCIRTFRNTIRDPAMVASQIIVSSLLALLTGLVFNQIQRTVEPGVQNRLGVIFFVITNQIFSTATALEPLVHERALFIHVKNIFQRIFCFLFDLISGKCQWLLSSIDIFYCQINM
jgi:ATP-binding cassette subfamily G (WHITE) protein 2